MPCRSQSISDCFSSEVNKSMILREKCFDVAFTDCSSNRFIIILSKLVDEPI